MIEANILIDRDLTIKGYRKAYGLKVFGSGGSFYGWRAFAVFLPVAFADAFYDRAELVGVHLFIIIALAVAASAHHYFDWLKELYASAEDYVLDVVLDDEGVTFSSDNKRIEWSAYDYFREYEDYLEITNKAGDVSFLPKRDEFADVIVFTKTKIPNKEF
jgi:hypothetical protein